LTRPFFWEFAASLTVPVVLWHSQLGVPERRRAWLGLRAGEVKVVVGARSAALLPFKDLRLVVLDEEQDESFKQEGQSPLYHARDVALHRARTYGAPVVLGSATPSLESWAMARRGEALLVTMAERVSAVARPKVTVLPMPAFGRCLSEELVVKLKERLARREQSILLVNRRGFATLLMCCKCGWVDRCPDCGVAKVQHAQPDGTFILLCHHCSQRGGVPASCPECGNTALRITGIGTQRVVAELKKALPGVRALRMDRDSLSKEGKEEKRIYEKFLAREADVLVGTKLVAKSFHFPEVTLVGVVDADTMINMPDFRSSERTMQLLSQVAGRSGRAGKAGEVLLQTLHPDHLAISGAVRGDYGQFADRELALRRELAYPPHSVLVRLILIGAKEENVAEAGARCAESLREKLAVFGHEVLGPAPAVLRLAAKQFRYHILLKVHEPERCLDDALSCARACELPSSVRMKINVDPYDLF
jgi:primosomal protein N' (replication factor Y)